MTAAVDPALDLTFSRLIKAPRQKIWAAWTEPRLLEQWFVPAPSRCRVVTLELRPGGGFVTEFSEQGDGHYVPHINGCILAAEAPGRLVFTDALTGGWRPSGQPFMTAVVTLREHAQGTDYAAHVLHQDAAVRQRHLDMGFHDGWGAVSEQLARLVEA